MKCYKTTAVITLPAGNLELDEDQVRRRKNLIEENDDGSWSIVKPVQFKIGEEFGYDGDIPKRMADDLADPDAEEKPKGKSRAKPKKKAAAPKPEKSDDDGNGDGDGGGDGSPDTDPALPI